MPTLHLPPLSAALWLLTFLVFLAPKLLIASIPVSHLPVPLRLAVTYALPGLALHTLFYPSVAVLLATLALALLAALPHLAILAAAAPTLASHLARQLQAYLAPWPKPPPEPPPESSPDLRFAGVAEPSPAQPK